MNSRRDFFKKILKLFKFSFISVLLPTSLTVFLTSCFSVPIHINSRYRSDHYDGKKFFHPKHQIQRKTFSEVIKWQRTRVSGYWPEKVEIKPSVPPERVNSDKLLVTFVGHATVLVQTEGLNILFDPHWSDRASPVSFVGPKRVTPPGINLTDLPKINYILISHNHYDHLDLTTLRKIDQRQKNISLIIPLGNKSIIDMGIKNHSFDIKELDWEQKIKLNTTLSAIVQPTFHWSARGISDSNKSLWAAFVLESPNGNIYFAGDTGFGLDEYAGSQFKETQKKFKKFRFSMIPIGAYEPRWFMRNQHINPEEAVEASKLLKSKYNLGIHLNTFKDLTDESFDAPIKDLQIALNKNSIQNKNFKVIKAGDTWEVPLA